MLVNNVEDWLTIVIHFNITCLVYFPKRIASAIIDSFYEMNKLKKQKKQNWNIEKDDHFTTCLSPFTYSDEW